MPALFVSAGFGMLDYDVVIVGAGPAGGAAARSCIAGGLKTLIIEKRKIPRHKACSGILVPAAVNSLRQTFGPLPGDVMADPSELRALRMHFPGGRTLDVPLGGVLIRRERFDHWLCRSSGAEIDDGTTIRSFQEQHDHVVVRGTRQENEKWEILCRVLIAADGGTSTVVRALDPGRHEKLDWYTALQESYECRPVLEPGYFHFFAFPEVSLYASAYVKDGSLVMEVVASRLDNVTQSMGRFRELLWPQIGVNEAKRVQRLGCRVAYAATKGLFHFGNARVLVAGEAAGFLNLFGEGISSALASGTLAGDAAVQAIEAGAVPGLIYRKYVESEKRRTLRQFSLRAYIRSNDVIFDFRKSFIALARKKRIILLLDFMRWLIKVKLFAGR